MADTTFSNGTTLSDADWFNDVNRLHYTILSDPADAAEVRTALSLVPGTNVQAYVSPGTSGNVLTSNGSAWTSAAAGGGYGKVQDFRLTLTTAVPVTTSDVTGATTIYCTPYKGNQISLYDGANWNAITSAEFSLALGTLTSGKPYDVFCYNNSGTPTLEFLVWTNDTTRATALAYQDGVLVKSGAATRRYLGTFYTTATTTTEDSAANRYLWNYYNRVTRKMRRIESTNSWTYTTASWRQANGSASNQLNFIQGVAEDAVVATVRAEAANSGGSVAISSGIALDSTATPDHSAIAYQAAGNYCSLIVPANYDPQLGRHYISWLEYCPPSGTTTWYGAVSAPAYAYGLIGSIMG